MKPLVTMKIAPTRQHLFLGCALTSLCLVMGCSSSARMDQCEADIAALRADLDASRTLLSEARAQVNDAVTTLNSIQGGKSAPSNAIQADVIIARELRIIDSNAKVRTTLGTDSNGPKLTLFDKTRSRIIMNIGETGPALQMSDSSGETRLMILAADFAPAIALSDSNGTTRATMSALPAEGAGIVLHNEQGAGIAEISRKGINLSDDNGNIIWHAP